LVLYFI